MNPESVSYVPAPLNESVWCDNPSIHLARPDEALHIWHMVDMKSQEENSGVLARPYEEIERIIPHILVYEDEDGIVGCASAEQYDGEHGEIRMVVSNKKGVGKALLPEAVKYTKLLGIREVFLTTSIPEYFLKLNLGFEYMKDWRNMLWRNPEDIVPDECMALPGPFQSGEIRRGQQRDTDGIKKLIEQESLEGRILPWSDKEPDGFIENFLVYEREEKIIACIAFLPYGQRIMEARALVVDPKHRGKGVARAMVRAGDSLILESGIKQVFIAVTDEQKEFMEKFGYTRDKTGKDVLWLTNY